MQFVLKIKIIKELSLSGSHKKIFKNFVNDPRQLGSIKKRKKNLSV